MRKLITLVIVVGLFYACGGPSHEGSAVRSVVLTVPELAESTLSKHYSGIVREAHMINLGFKTAGQIQRLYVQEGDYVRQGELLAELDAADYRLGVEALQIQYNQLKDEVKRTEQLFKQKSISANDYEKALAGLNQLGIQLQINQNKLDYTKLYAPTNGYIQSVNFAPAEMVDAGTALFTLLDVSHMEVVADIPIDTYRACNRSSRYYCQVAGTEKSCPMTLLSLTPRADGNQLYRLRLAFADRPDERLTAGMNVEVGIVVTDTTSSPQYILPLSAVFRDKDSACVWVFESDSTVSKRHVVLDEKADAEGRAMVVEGLTGHEQIVRAGVNVLQEGEQVRVIARPSQTNVGGLL